MDDNVIIVSADGHAGASPEDYRPYLDPLLRDRFEDLLRDNERHVRNDARFARYSEESMAFVDESGAMRSGGSFGVWDTARRLDEMDREGIAAEVLFWGHQHSVVPFFTPGTPDYPADVQAAGARTYHRWLADHVADGGGRLLAVGDASGADMDVTVRELRWLGDHGFVAVALPGHTRPPELPPLYDRFYEPFWKACLDNGLRVAMHVGWGGPPEATQTFKEGIFATLGDDEEFNLERFALMQEQMMGGGSKNPFGQDIKPARAAWQMMVGGVFDRYPELTLVLTEVRADWAPGLLALFDNRFERGDTPLRRRPSEYFRDHCYLGASSIHRREIELRHEIGVQRMMFGRDYPHTEGTWPNTREWLQAAFHDVPEDEARLILGENAIACYDLDRVELAAVAADVGFPVTDILGTHPVEPRLVDHFHMRGGFNKPEPPVDVDAAIESLDADLADFVPTG